MAVNKSLEGVHSEVGKVVSIETSKSQVGICPRDEKGRFIKGFSGNPNAWATRKLNTPLALLCREKVEDWANVLDSIIKNERVDPSVRVAALKIGFEYGYGKALQGSDAGINECRDYDNYVKSLARELHEEFDFREGNIVDSEQKIKGFIAQRIGNGSSINKIFDDVLKHVGSFSFQCYLDKLNEGNVWYKYID